MGNFEQSLSIGKAGEDMIAMWLRRRGNHVLPVYEKIIDEGKGPHLFMSLASKHVSLVAPDLLVLTNTQPLWVEAKRKTAFTLHRNTNQLVTGIDLHHYEQYKEVEKETGVPVWLLFLQEGGQAKDSPPNSPSGLFGNSLQYLSAHEHHSHPNWGRHGMMYWCIEDLYLMAPLEELTTVDGCQRIETATGVARKMGVQE